LQVRIIKDWKTPDIFRQTPGEKGKWDNLNFLLDPIKDTDYAIICNRVPIDIEINCDKKNIWAITQEPPVPEYRWLRKGFYQFEKVFTQDKKLKGNKYIYSQPALCWHINKNYDFLKNCKPPEKNKNLSWITSNETSRPGHRKRMKFLESIKDSLDFDLWGKGFNFIEDKWDGLSSYKYALAIENHRCYYYWTEKLSDCFLSWTMPIYYGCKNIFDFFPKESMIIIDINNPKESIQIIKESISKNLYEKNIEAIRYSRELILEKYQFFPYFTDMINKDREKKNGVFNTEIILLKKLPNLYEDRGFSLDKMKKIIIKILKFLGIKK
jgi:hypothetical protein